MSVFLCVILVFMIIVLLTLTSLLEEENKDLYRERNTISLLYSEEKQKATNASIRSARNFNKLSDINKFLDNYETKCVECIKLKLEIKKILLERK